MTTEEIERFFAWIRIAKGVTKIDMMDAIGQYYDEYQEAAKMIPFLFETDLYQLINKYCSKGLKKPDLISKMEYVLQSCKVS